MNNKKTENQIKKILNYCKKIDKTNDKKYIFSEEESFYYDLICFYIIQIGEIVNKLDEEFIKKYNEISWNSIRGMRNVLVHNYGALNKQIIDETINNDIPILKNFCVSYLNKNNAYL